MGQVDWELEQMQNADDLLDCTDDLALALSRIHELRQGIRYALDGHAGRDGWIDHLTALLDDD